MVPTFTKSINVPIDFEGRCKILDEGCYCWFIKGKILHRLDGPACVMIQSGSKFFVVENNILLEENYWNHPLVIDNKIKTILAI